MATQRSTVSLCPTCQIPILSCPLSVNLPALLYQTDTKRKPGSEEKLEPVFTNEWVRSLLYGSLVYRLVLHTRWPFTLSNFSKIPLLPPKSSPSSHSSILSHPHQLLQQQAVPPLQQCHSEVPGHPCPSHLSLITSVTISSWEWGDQHRARKHGKFVAVARGTWLQVH